MAPLLQSMNLCSGCNRLGGGRCGGCAVKAGDDARASFHFNEASKMYEEAISQQVQKSSDTSDRPTILLSVQLATCLRELAKYEEAEKVLAEGIERIDGSGSNGIAGLNSIEDKQDYVGALAAMATLYQAQSKYAPAIELHKKAVALARSIDASVSGLCLADSIAGYAETLRKSGDLSQAESYHREVLEIRIKALTEDLCTELDLAVSYTQLGCTLAEMNSHEEAYKYHALALKLRYRYLDFSHGLISESLNYCAEGLCNIDRGAEAVPLAFHSVQARKRVFGESHPAYAHSLSVLASCYNAVGRYLDAQDCIERCLGICESVFHQNHANLIPNLMNQGDILLNNGNFKRARAVFERAAAIHQINFMESKQCDRLQRCLAGVAKAEEGMSSNEALQLKCSFDKSITTSSIEAAGTPVIVFTDIGRDVDDEMALVMLSALRRKCLLNPVAVIATLSPQHERAFLARGSMDALGMADVPVGIGSSGGVSDGIELECYDASYSVASPDIYESGMELVQKVLGSAPVKSVQILCLASLTDVATLIREQEDLFASKVKEVVLMGGVMPIKEDEMLSPDSAYNNNCDISSARYVYKRCQELQVPSVTLTRWAAYGCPCRPLLMDELARTDHMIAVNIQTVMQHGVDSLWNKVKLSPEDQGREKLPARCNVDWFCKVFIGNDRFTEGVSSTMQQDKWPTSVWTLVTKLNMYDPLAVMVCVESYRSLYFDCTTKEVNRVEHIVLGQSEADNGVVDEQFLFNEYSKLFTSSFQTTLHRERLSPLRLSQIE